MGRRSGGGSATWTGDWRSAASGSGFVVGLDGHGRWRADDAAARPGLRRSSADRGVERPRGVVGDEAVRRDRARPPGHRELRARAVALHRIDPVRVRRRRGVQPARRRRGRRHQGAARHRVAPRRDVDGRPSGDPAAPRDRADGRRAAPDPSPAGPDDPHRGHRRLHRRHDVGRLRFAHDRDAVAALPDALRGSARRHRPRAGDPARGCGRARPHPVR